MPASASMRRRRRPLQDFSREPHARHAARHEKVLRALLRPQGLEPRAATHERAQTLLRIGQQIQFFAPGGLSFLESHGVRLTPERAPAKRSSLAPSDKLRLPVPIPPVLPKSPRIACLLALLLALPVAFADDLDALIAQPAPDNASAEVARQRIDELRTQGNRAPRARRGNRAWLIPLTALPSPLQPRPRRLRRFPRPRAGRFRDHGCRWYCQRDSRRFVPETGPDSSSWWARRQPRRHPAAFGARADPLVFRRELASGGVPLEALAFNYELVLKRLPASQRSALARELEKIHALQKQRADRAAAGMPPRANAWRRPSHPSITRTRPTRARNSRKCCSRPKRRGANLPRQPPASTPGQNLSANISKTCSPAANTSAANGSTRPRSTAARSPCARRNSRAASIVSSTRASLPAQAISRRRTATAPRGSRADSRRRHRIFLLP